MDPRLAAFIRIAAQRFNLDPRAMMSISHHESGGRLGAVGDNGTSFGPFQLHIGGAMPSGQSPQWANSLQGVLYAAQRMAASGAAGKRGLAAINAISRNFERPANPGAEIADAWNWYRQNGGVPTALGSRGGAGPSGAGVAGKIPSGLGPQATQPNKAALASTLWNFATTGGQAQQVGLPNPVTMQPGTAMLQMVDGYMGTHPAAPPNPSPKTGTLPGMTNPKIASILAHAHSVVGTPYVWGGESKQGFDCSGLVQWAYGQAGIHIGRTTYDQIKQGAPVQWGHFQPGDLIFSNFEGPGAGPSHVVMYVGNGKVIAAPETGQTVQYQSVNLFRNAFVGARRIV